MSYSRIQDEFSEDSASDGKREVPIWPSRSSAHFFSYRSLFGATLALWIATSIALGWVIVKKGERHENHAATPLPFPSVPSRVVTFDIDSRFHYTAAGSGTPAWSGLMPNGGGIVSVEQPQKYLLAASYKNRNDSDAEVYSTSMFHQLHCLNSIRVRLGTLEGFMNDTTAGLHQRDVFAPESHVDHCFDYLRQAIMCAGDLSLEHSVVPDQFGFNGWGTSHQCSDWKSMWDIAEDHQYDQSVEQ
ncbi:hypothetical protein EJ02DRAFT_160641 [Clathrospora elynae]|uniref:Uncharacterized protein n=1 Tax=Clathrospora elynae TaxID=706981 RepID=A0A6A5ST05_9PLEO|nr:hypothetical protein EJ02DRAFT_160641 [Clathrospora elynae]